MYPNCSYLEFSWGTVSGAVGYFYFSLFFHFWGRTVKTATLYDIVVDCMFLNLVHYMHYAFDKNVGL